MRPWLIFGMVTLGLLAGVSCLDGWEHGRRACRAIQSWWLWGMEPPPPNSDYATVRVPFPDAEAGGTISGLLVCRNGRRGWSEGDGLPLRGVHVHFGGISVAIENGRWWRPSPEGELLRTPRPTLVASITCCRPKEPSRVLDHSIHDFGRENQVELALPFEVTVLPARGASAGALRYEARLGDLYAEGRQEWQEEWGEFAPIMRAERGATVSAAIVHGVAGRCYAEVELRRDGSTLGVEGCCADRETWRLAGEGGRIRCLAVATGLMAQPSMVSLPCSARAM
ncbi:MAG: hypothetical protein GF393_09040 [Armatimonadia bacterium]|nr:hypothetical protein [Armatimonadia bacterium]